jgi:hypothetical protein
MVELDAVNMLLEAIGSDVINSLDNTHPDAVAAARVLQRQAKMELRKGWWFNTDWGVNYEPDANREIVIPNNISSIRMENVDYVRRNSKLYDKVNQTYKFDGTQPAHQQIRLPLWDEMEADMQVYAAYLAASEFILNETGNDTLVRAYGVKAGLALIELKRTDLKQKNLNMFNGNQYRSVRGGSRPAGYRGTQAGTLVSDTLQVNK